MRPELHRPLSLDRLPREMLIEADAVEREAIAARLRIPEVVRLSCQWRLKRRGQVIEAAGELEAEVVQACVVTLEPVPQTVRERFTVRFVPAGEEDDDDPESVDDVPYDGSALDLGEATTEQLALALDPYPRAPDAELQPDVVELGKDPALEGPFAALRRLG